MYSFFFLIKWFYFTYLLIHFECLQPTLSSLSLCLSLSLSLSHGVARVQHRTCEMHLCLYNAAQKPWSTTETFHFLPRFTRWSTPNNVLFCHCSFFVAAFCGEQPESLRWICYLLNIDNFSQPSLLYPLRQSQLGTMSVRKGKPRTPTQDLAFTWTRCCEQQNWQYSRGGGQGEVVFFTMMLWAGGFRYNGIGREGRERERGRRGVGGDYCLMSMVCRLYINVIEYIVRCKVRNIFLFLLREWIALCVSVSVCLRLSVCLSPSLSLYIYIFSAIMIFSHCR